MTRISTLGYSIKQGFKNIYRNRMFSLASMGTIAACIFMFGIFYFIIMNFQYMVKNAENHVGVTIFFQDGLPEAAIKKIGKEIKKWPEVKEIEYTSAEEAWEKFCEENFEDKEALQESFGEDNPLEDSASYEVNLKDVENQEKFVEFAGSIEGVRQVNSSQSAAKTLSGVNQLIAYVSGAVILILLSVAIFLIHTTVTMGIAVRKDEIAIMRLVGATDFFIRAPFVVEGIAIGLAGTCFPLILLYVVYEQVITYILGKFRSLSHILTFLDHNTLFIGLVPIASVIGIGIGFLGSFVTVRKHLNV